MKELNFKTSKGNFILVDDEPNLKKFIPWDLCEFVGIVKDMTEEQFSAVVENSIYSGLYAHYVKDVSVNIYCYKSAEDSFNTLIRSLDIYLFEPPVSYAFESCKSNNIPELCKIIEYNNKTFYNPILLKKL